MRFFAVSDIHVDYEVNARWVAALPRHEYGDDVLILAGDVSDSLAQLERTLETLAARFKKVFYVPGNHDLWVVRDARTLMSLDKFEQVRTVAARSGVCMHAATVGGVTIVPLLGWYDYSFGWPSRELRDRWMDYHACRWPSRFEVGDVARYFHELNRPPHSLGETVISFSHFLPRIDVMPSYIPSSKRFLYPVLGSAQLDEQVRACNAKIHVYGHSHVNRRVDIGGVTYVNNAFGYPRETRIAAKKLLCVHAT